MAEVCRKFDYFMAGLVTAVTAYVGRTYRPGPLGWNPDALELVALMAFVASAVAAFKRIETFNTVSALTSVSFDLKKLPPGWRTL